MHAVGFGFVAILVVAVLVAGVASLFIAALANSKSRRGMLWILVAISGLAMLAFLARAGSPVGMVILILTIFLIAMGMGPFSRSATGRSSASIVLTSILLALFLLVSGALLITLVGRGRSSVTHELREIPRPIFGRSPPDLDLEVKQAELRARYSALEAVIRDHENLDEGMKHTLERRLDRKSVV